MTLPFIEKYRAKNFEEIKGQDSAIQDLKIFFKTFPRKRALILNGPAGSGKTSMAIALAKEFNLELFELNASDLRNKQSLDEILRPASSQQSLFKKGKIILMDEADGITGTDRGGLPELINLIQKTSFPIIITSNDIWNKKFSLLRQKCQLVNLKELNEDMITSIIKNVIDKENKMLESTTIKILAKKSRGDVRSALNDLQIVLSRGEGTYLSDTFISEKKDILDSNEFDVNDISEREKTETIFNALKKIFQSPTDRSTIKIFDNVNVDMDELRLWVEENIPVEYKGVSLAKAYDALSKADIFKGRIYRQQYWRFLVYENFFLTAGISSATKIKYNKFNQYQRPSRILKIWMSNQKNVKKKSIIAKYANRAHMSVRKASKEYFLLPLILNEKSYDKLDLEESEIEYIKDKRGAIIVSQGLNKFRKE